MWPRWLLGWCEPLYPWSSSGSKTTWVGGSNVLGLMGQPRNGPMLPLAFRREVSLVHYCLEESLMISRMPPKARLWLNCNEKSKDNWNFKPTRPLFLCQRWQPAGSSSTVFAFYFFVTLSNWGEWSKDKISFNRKKKTECEADNARQSADIFGYNISGNQTRLSPKKNTIINGS